MASKEAGNYYPQTDDQPLDRVEIISLAIAYVLGAVAVAILAAVLVAQIYQGVAPRVNANLSF